MLDRVRDRCVHSQVVVGDPVDIVLGVLEHALGAFTVATGGGHGYAAATARHVLDQLGL
jgi:hypothetical protein